MYAALCAGVNLGPSIFLGTEDVGLDDGIVVDVLGIVDVGLDDDESSAIAAVAPLVMMSAMDVATSVFLANCLILSPSLGDFLILTINNEFVEIL